MEYKEGYTVLVVDDDKASINSLLYILRPRYSVLVAKSGESALRYAQIRQPDLILLDIIMPGMSGFETLVALKNCDLTRMIPVVFITGVSSVEDEHRGLILGAVDYITKPYNDAIVEARVRTHLQIVKNIRTIEHLCMIDPLTDIPNRRGFDKQLKTEWARMRREKKPLGLLMIDVDRFKAYNDTYGHAQGDVLLQSISKVFKSSLNRPGDYAARWGGEEFVILLPETDLKGAAKVANQIRGNIENAVCPCVGGEDTQITVSVGAASLNPTDGGKPDDLLSLADVALYRAKDGGRNMVVVHEACRTLHKV